MAVWLKRVGRAPEEGSALVTAFRPSEVILTEIPLVATMGRVEREAAATIIIRASVRGGDTWRPIYPAEIGEAIRLDLDEKLEPLTSLNRNPFWRPDFRDLAAAGYATSTFELGAPIEFTAKGLAALERWVRKDGAA